MGVLILYCLDLRGTMRGRRLDTLVGPSICMRYDTRSLILVVVISSNICVRVSGIVIRYRVV